MALYCWNEIVCWAYVFMFLFWHNTRYRNNNCVPWPGKPRGLPGPGYNMREKKFFFVKTRGLLFSFFIGFIREGYFPYFFRFFFRPRSPKSFFLSLDNSHSLEMLRSPPPSPAVTVSPSRSRTSWSVIAAWPGPHQKVRPKSSYLFRKVYIW